MEKSQDDRRFNFTIIDNEVIDTINKIGLAAYGVYTVIVRMANSENKCFPGQKYISDKLGIGERSVRRAIKILEDSGMITIERTTGFQNVYHVNNVTKTPSQHAIQPRPQVPQTPATLAAPSGHTGRTPRPQWPTNKIDTIPIEQEAAGCFQENLKPLFRKITAELNEPDLVPTLKRLEVLRKAMSDVNINGFDNIVLAAQNLARSGEVDCHKRYDWLLNNFDYAEHITMFLTRKASGTKTAKFTGYDEAPIKKFEGYSGN